MKITKRQLRRIIKEEKAQLLVEYNPAEDGMAAAREDERVRGGGGHPEDEYVKLIKEIGARSFAKGLIWALGDMSGYRNGHEGIIEFIKENS